MTDRAPDTVDVLILGAGPAGLTAAQYGARANLAVLVIEELAPGGQALNIDVLENYPGNTGSAGPKSGGPRSDGPKSGFEFSQDLYRQAEAFGAAFLIDAAVSLAREDGGFTVTLAGGGKRRAQAVILATGAKHRRLDIPGEERLAGRGVSYCATCDGPFFKGKKIFVVGGGDAACDEAQYLSRLSDRVTLIHRRDRFRAQKALAERVLRNGNIEVRFNTVMREIRGERKVSSVLLEKRNGGAAGQYEESADAVFVFTGAVPQTALVTGPAEGPAGIAAALDEAGYVVTDQGMASSVPGLFAAGDVRASPFRQVVTACGDGALAANSAAKYLDELRGEGYGARPARSP
jgi:thioredoxin reductase (NADPH)